MIRKQKIIGGTEICSAGFSKKEHIKTVEKGYSVMVDIPFS